MVKTDLKKTIKTIVSQLVGVLNTRNRDIVSRRFGLKTGDRQTLESIGDIYGITRERVRQIEEVSLKQIRATLASGFKTKIQPFVTLADTIIEQAGSILKEDELFNKFFGNTKNGSANAALVFILILDNQLKRFVEEDNFNTFWSNSDAKQKEFINSVATFINALEKHKTPIEEAKIADFCSQSSVYFKEPIGKVLASFMAISKRINRNVFGQIGLTSWPEIRPRGVRDKSYLVLKRANTPKHFREITQLINTHGFSKRKANVQTVHNELIKDQRFVLVGRGMYGLSEWGYERGTIKELIVNLLKQKGALSRDQVVAHVMAARFVKQNTIILGLKDKKLFKHDEKGVIHLKDSR